MLGWQEVILVLAILLLVFGPAELPKIARELGNAWHEFNKASSGLAEAVTSQASEKKGKEEDQLLTEVAKKLSVATDGKTNDQLTKEVLTKIINKDEKSN